MTDPAFLLALAAAILGAASIVLHVVAPKTKTTVDDQLRDDIDEVLAFIRGGAPTAVAPKPPIGPVAVLALVVLGVAASSQLACTAAQRTATGPALIDCTSSNGAAIGATATSMRGDCVVAGTTSWTCVETHAAAAAVAIGGCAFLEVLTGPGKTAGAAAASSAPDPAGRAAFERYRAAAGGATFRTAAGDR